MDCRSEYDEHKHDEHEEHHHEGHEGHDHSHTPDDVDGDSLFNYIDIDNIIAYNAQLSNNTNNYGIICKPYHIREDSQVYMYTDPDDEDPELIIYIPFTEEVKLKSICIKSNVYSNDDDVDRVEGISNTSIPREMKLYVNKYNTLDFNNINDTHPIQTIQCIQPMDQLQNTTTRTTSSSTSNSSNNNSNSGDSSDIWYPLNISKFNNISNLTIYIPSSYDDICNVIDYIGLKGLNLSLKHSIVQAVYETQGSIFDHKQPDDLKGNFNL